MAILVVGLFWNDALVALLSHQFDVVQREDATVVFTRPDERPRRARKSGTSRAFGWQREFARSP